MKFRCKVCGYIYEGDELPADYVCPLCKKGPEAFEALPEEKPQMKKFRCKVCGYVHEAEELPADFVCPVCHKGADVFVEIDAPKAKAGSLEGTKTAENLAAAFYAHVLVGLEGETVNLLLPVGVVSAKKRYFRGVGGIILINEVA